MKGMGRKGNAARRDMTVACLCVVHRVGAATVPKSFSVVAERNRRAYNIQVLS